MTNMKKMLITTAVATSMAITGCASTGSNTGNTDTAKKAGLGALAGAVLGAGISKATGGEHTKRDAAIGAAIHHDGGVHSRRQRALQLLEYLVDAGGHVEIVGVGRGTGILTWRDGRL